MLTLEAGPDEAGTVPPVLSQPPSTHTYCSEIYIFACGVLWVYTRLPTHKLTPLHPRTHVLMSYQK